jgi:protein AbiQ
LLLHCIPIFITPSTHSFIADGSEAGLDFTKAVVITDKARYIESSPTTIRQHEFNMLKQHEYEIGHKFEKFVLAYTRHVRRIQKNPRIPIDPCFQYSCLQYFHKELGLPLED